MVLPDIAQLGWVLGSGLRGLPAPLALGSSAVGGASGAAGGAGFLAPNIVRHILRAACYDLEGTAPQDEQSSSSIIGWASAECEELDGLQRLNAAASAAMRGGSMNAGWGNGRHSHAAHVVDGLSTSPA